MTATAADLIAWMQYKHDQGHQIHTMAYGNGDYIVTWTREDGYRIQGQGAPLIQALRNCCDGVTKWRNPDPDKMPYARRPE